MADLAGSAMPGGHRLRRDYQCPLSGSMLYAADGGTTTDWLGATHSSTVSRARVSGLFSAVSRLYRFRSGYGMSRSVPEMSMDESGECRGEPAAPAEEACYPTLSTVGRSNQHR